MLRLLGLFSLAIDPCERKTTKVRPWKSILGYKDFMFYLIAYVLFNAANGLVSFVWAGLPKTPDYQSAFATGTVVHYLGTGLFALVGGIAADRIGRKKPIIFGLILLELVMLL